MTLQPGFRLVVAPSFHLPVDWSQRALVSPGVERLPNGFFPRPDWRPPDERELALLAADGALPPGSQAPSECLCLFQLPQHLRSAWWAVMEQASDSQEGRLEGLDAFVAAVADFLAFKDLPVPVGAAFDLVVSKPGLRSLHQEEAAAGLAFNLAAETACPLAEEGPRPRLWGALNLGEEPTSLVFVNLTARGLLAELERLDAMASSPTTFGELAEQFLACCSDYPSVRLRVEPGEGLCLPAGGALVDFCTLDKKEPDVLLLIHAEERKP